MKEFLQAILNAYLNRKNEKADIFLQSDNYPLHNELIKKINEENKLRKMLNISNPLLQKLVIWGVNNNKLSIRLDQIKYFDKYIKENENNELIINEPNLESVRTASLLFILMIAALIVVLQFLMSAGLYVFFSFSLIAIAIFLFFLAECAFAPSKEQTKVMKKFIQEYNDQNRGDS